MATLAKYPAILPKLRYLPKVRLNIRHFLTLTKGPGLARGSAFRPGQRSGSGRRVKSNLRLNTGILCHGELRPWPRPMLTNAVRASAAPRPSLETQVVHGTGMFLFALFAASFSHRTLHQNFEERLGNCVTYVLVAVSIRN